jgi:hypothetical protein
MDEHTVLVDETHAAQPGFLLDQPTLPAPTHTEESPCRRSH